jgi:hypothetical protein
MPKGTLVERTDGLRLWRMKRSTTARLFGVFALVFIAVAFFWLVGIYSAALRDPRFLDGWALAIGMGAQLLFHVALKTRWVSPRAKVRWRSVHIIVGYLLVAVFISHSKTSLPGSNFGWALWLGFSVVTLSGLFGTYLDWSAQSLSGIDQRWSSERIRSRIGDLALELNGVVAAPERAAGTDVLPASPSDIWISDLHAKQLRSFFAGPQNASFHLIGSQRPLKRLLNDLNALSPYVDTHGQEKLFAIWKLIVEKDRLDAAFFHFRLIKYWLFVHVPATYGLIVLSILHVIVVYSYSSGTL